MRRAHQHDCSICGEPYDCAGLPEYNHDPDGVRCSYRDENTECRECYDKPQCSWCGLKTGELIADADTGEVNHAACVVKHQEASS